MKNKINILILGFLLTSGSLLAQKAEFGIKGGVNIPTSDAVIGANLEQSGASGYHAGDFCQIQICIYWYQP